jgi:hypothetical protein
MHHIVDVFEHKDRKYMVSLFNVGYHYEPCQFSDMNSPFLPESFEFNCESKAIFEYVDEDKPYDLKVIEDRLLLQEIEDKVFERDYDELTTKIKRIGL